MLRFHTNREFEDLFAYLLGYNAVGSCEINRRFEGTYRLPLPGRRVVQERNQHETGKIC
jgi:hypothetical protein